MVQGSGLGTSSGGEGKEIDHRCTYTLHNRCHGGTEHRTESALIGRDTTKESSASSFQLIIAIAVRDGTVCLLVLESG